MMTWNDSHGGRDLMEDKGKDHVVVEEESWIKEKKVLITQLGLRYVCAVQWLPQQLWHGKLKNLFDRDEKKQWEGTLDV